MRPPLLSQGEYCSSRELVSRCGESHRRSELLQAVERKLEVSPCRGTRGGLGGGTGTRSRSRHDGNSFWRLRRACTPSHWTGEWTASRGSSSSCSPGKDCTQLQLLFRPEERGQESASAFHRKQNPSRSPAKSWKERNFVPTRVSVVSILFLLLFT